ncbi:MAG: GNAT family acetyltransferase [Anaerolineaceae bacterium]
MSQKYVITEFSFDRDVADVIDLWKGAGNGIQLRESDRPEEIRKKILRDPDLFLLARNGEAIIGAVMGGFDGRRGFIYHLAVAERHRHKGIARLLMDELEFRLKAKGCLKVNLLVTQGNKTAMAFYEGLGYEHMPVVPFGKKLI